ncbi:MAG: TniQ family protein [Mitsuaria chitosanitabida]|uniref:TnsD family Tn7-like transposition protein n=1 Tax=Roseateles chitosanitabidus TaxID=65048 RepID=UPI001B1B3153|nr:TnsD family Tn7-like transposition protein [Roseateles chitosanitabidus]MBO9687092.1 TniQ family protein [Roseateles chitosanitabidus]
MGYEEMRTSSRAEIFPRGPLPEWIAAETFFSLVSRIHGLWGCQHAWQVCEWLLGQRRAPNYHDLPGALDAFCVATGHVYGDTRTIALERTLLRFYQPFLDEGMVRKSVDQMGSASVAHLKFRIGVLTGGMRANHPLKACPECMASDVTEHGCPTWHLDHQYPCVWFCPKHGVPLRVSTRKSTGVGRFQWAVPRLTELMTPPSFAETGPQAEMLRLGQMTATLIESSPVGGLADSRTSARFLRRLQDLGWRSAAGRMNVQVLRPALRDYLQRLQGLPELSRTADSMEDMAGSLANMLVRPRPAVHPVKTLLAIHFLFDDYGDYAGCESDASGGNACSVEPQVSKDEECGTRQVVQHGLDQGSSMREIARVSGLAVGTVQAWAAKLGVESQRRPKLVKEAVRRALLERLRHGEDKSTAAAACGVSVQVVTRLLRSVPGLRQAWSSARHSKRKEECRLAWHQHCIAGAGAGVNFVRALVPEVYAWLYRNDRAWLNANKPASLPPLTRRRTVDWGRRDEELRRSVLVAANKLREAGRDGPLRLWEIYQRVPELKARLSSLPKLPLTRQALWLVLEDRQTSRSTLI